MKCERARELFSEYLEGGADYALTATVRGHIGQCQSCGSEFELFRQTYELLDTLPQVEPPRDLRHEVVMRAARVQHAERWSAGAKSAWTINWDVLLGRLRPARAVAIACAGAVLAVILLGVPRSAYQIVLDRLTSGTEVAVNMKASERPGDAIEASPLSQLELGRRREWQARKLGRNTLWVTVKPTDDPALYQIRAAINYDALLVGEMTARIGAKVYLMPAGGSESLVDESVGTLYWQGNVLKDEPIQVPVIADESEGRAVLVVWDFRHRHFAQVVFLPAQRRVSPSDDVFRFSVSGGGLRSTGDLYAALDTIARGYGVPIIANAFLTEKPSMIDFGDETLDQVLIKALKPIELDWLSADGAIYVDREYDVP
jgi:hypothetical protein